MEIAVLGIDLAKCVFQLHGADSRGRALHRSKVNPQRLIVEWSTKTPRSCIISSRCR